MLTFKQVQENDGSNYSCIASNEVDSAIRSTLLIVNILPKWTIEPPNKMNAVLGSKLVVNCGKSPLIFHEFPMIKELLTS